MVTDEGILHRLWQMQNPKMQIANFFSRSIFRKGIGVGAEEVTDEGILRCKHVAKVTLSSIMMRLGNTLSWAA